MKVCLKTGLKRLGTVDDRFAHFIFEGMSVKDMAQKICWTENRIAKYINSHWKIGFHFNELKDLAPKIKTKGPILVGPKEKFKTVAEAIKVLDLRTKKRGIWVIPEVSPNRPAGQEEK